MKRGIKRLIILVCVVIGLIYFKINEQPITDSQIEVKTETKRVQQETSLGHQMPVKTTDSDIAAEVSTHKMVSSFTQMLEMLEPHEREKYLTLNEQLFGALDFADHKSYQIFLKQGFPSLKEIDYVSQNDTKLLGLALFNNASSYPIFDEDPSLNLPALSAINLIKTIEELETVVRYYLPNYRQGEPFPDASKWPNGKRPEQIDEALRRIIQSYSGVREYKAIEYLARARFEQLNFGAEKGHRNVTAVLTKLAIADKKLGGNSNISNYVAQHYPEHIEIFENLRSDL
mgnify:CR=1 FL=1